MYGISPDAPPALVKFRAKYGLPFPLLSDPDHKVAAAYGAWGEKRRAGKTSEGIIRSHFAVDEEGRLAELQVGETELGEQPEGVVHGWVRWQPLRRVIDRQRRLADNQ